jgi:hypothetical protein
LYFLNEFLVWGTKKKEDWYAVCPLAGAKVLVTRLPPIDYAEWMYRDSDGDILGIIVKTLVQGLETVYKTSRVFSSFVYMPLVGAHSIYTLLYSTLPTKKPYLYALTLLSKE